MFESCLDSVHMLGAGMESRLTDGQRKIVTAWGNGMRALDAIAEAAGLSQATVKPFLARLGKLTDGEFAELKRMADSAAAEPPRAPPPTRRRGKDIEAPSDPDEVVNFTLRMTKAMRADWEDRRKSEGFTSTNAWVLSRLDSDLPPSYMREFAEFAVSVADRADRALAGLPPSELGSLLRELRDEATKIRRQLGR